MYVILVYDIETVDNEDQKRLNRVRIIVRQFLQHTQKSVFEGYITEAKLFKLKRLILETIDPVRDSVIIYKILDNGKWEKEFLTKKKDDTPHFF